MVALLARVDEIVAAAGCSQVQLVAVGEGHRRSPCAWGGKPGDVNIVSEG